MLAGDSNDVRYWKGIELLRAGYAPAMLVDVRSGEIIFGRPMTAQTEEFIRRSASGLKVLVCQTGGDSTLEELQSANACIQPHARHGALLVTSDYHTWRALSIARKVYPQYTWSAAAANNGLLSDPQWWKRREVVKNVLLEWQKLAWWELVERH